MDDIQKHIEYIDSKIESNIPIPECIQYIQDVTGYTREDSLMLFMKWGKCKVFVLEHKRFPCPELEYAGISNLYKIVLT